MKSLRLQAPAKLNLFLQVHNKRKDGYHNLTTLFERINLFDDIRLTSRLDKKIRVVCDHPQVPKGSKNLVYQVAALLQKEHGVPTGVTIQITKRIPVAAGLGGGSSDAAATLIGLNKFWKLSLQQSDLVAYGRRIGSDVPFFLYNCSWAIGTERGDKIKKLRFRRLKLWHILIVPRLKVYTREIFGTLNLGLTKKKANVNILHRSLRKNDLSQVGLLLLNDLETAIVQSHPNLLKIKEKLKTCHVLGALFSGSGPSIFGLVESKQKAQALKRVLGRQYSQVFAVRTW